MHNIRKIFIKDITALVKNPLALIIAGGLCVLPALYAWFNIYSNWDPYGNTGNIQIAVASNDKGYARQDGTYINAASAVSGSLKENKSIGWTAVKSEAEAVEGVKNGSYYAAVVFAEDFTECMYEGFLNGLRRPAVMYYENEKKNAVATKITDTAVSALEANINKQYIALVAGTLFEKQKDVADSLESAQITEEILSKIKRVQKTVGNYSATVKSLVRANDKLAASLDAAASDLNELGSKLGSVQAGAADVPDMQALADKLNAANARAVQSAGNALAQLRQAKQADIGERKDALYSQAAAGLSNAKNSLDSLINSVQSINAATVNNSRGIVLAQLENQSQSLGAVQERLIGSIGSRDARLLEETEKQLEQQVQAVQQALQGTVSQSLAMLGSGLAQALSDISQAAGNIKGDIALLNMVIGNSVEAVSLANKSFLGMAKDLDAISSKLSQVSDVVTAASQAQLAQGFLGLVQENAQEYGEFFANPVTVEAQAIYPVSNYGSGVAPFYTTLALWVGGVVLVSLIKVKAQAGELDSPKPHELFLGRYMLFLALALIQAAVTVWGNLYLLHIQCIHPRRFLLAAFIASLVFSLLIYTLTVSFGDLGKALAVVLMVIQIAGSSGTYPIEILPQFYQKVHIFFPFPYAIQAMREAVAGMYGNDYAFYLLKLALFAAAALALGLIIRLPFRKFCHFIEQRMEDTGMM